ncbi:MAG: MFS transporter [Pseudonocardia sp.]|nr:MFS transporter [Pseudonocardia sp.]
MTSAAAPASPATRGQVIAWGFWDWGNAAFNAVILTFVFSVYLTSAVGDGAPSASAALGWSIGVAGIALAVVAPVLAARADAAGRRKRATGVWTVATVVVMAAMVAVRDDSQYLALGLILLALGSVFSELAAVSYNAMLCQVSTPATMGRISGFGWAMGYLGGIVLLLGLYLGFIRDNDDGTAGLLAISTADGWNIRLVALIAAGWFLVSAIPMFVAVPEIPPDPNRPARIGVVASYRKLFSDVREIYRRDPHALWFLLSSALYRDGLAGIFTFASVLAVGVYGIDAADVLIFGVAANVVSAAGAFAGGAIEDRVGAKPVIVASLIGLIAVGVILLFVSGPTMFWIFGLFLSLFVGPAQSSSRTFLARIAPAGREGQFFGLYATTGRAASFLAPTLFGLFVTLFEATRAGIVGIVAVLVVGLAVFLPVRAPGRAPITLPN